jgi:hypothetical protein
MHYVLAELDVVAQAQQRVYEQLFDAVCREYAESLVQL